MIGSFWYSYNNHDMLVYLLAYVAHRKCLLFFAGDECRGDSSSGQDLVNDYPNSLSFLPIITSGNKDFASVSI